MFVWPECQGPLHYSDLIMHNRAQVTRLPYPHACPFWDYPLCETLLPTFDIYDITIEMSEAASVHSIGTSRSGKRHVTWYLPIYP